MNKNLLDTDQLQNQFVEIMTKNKVIDPETGNLINYNKMCYFRGCDGVFVYYSIYAEPSEPATGFMLATDIVDVFRLDHIEEVMGEDEGDDDSGFHA